MTHAAKIARDDAITEALRAADDAIGDEPPTEQAFRIIAAVKALRGDQVRVEGLKRVDYLTKVQVAAQAVWRQRHSADKVGPLFDANAGIDTPLGRLRAMTWRRVWTGGKIAWASEYYLDGKPITVAEIKAAGLALRPTSRNRKSKG